MSDTRTRHAAEFNVPVNRQRAYNCAGLQVISGAGVVFLHTTDREHEEMVAYLSPTQARKTATALMRAAAAMDTDRAMDWN